MLALLDQLPGALQFAGIAAHQRAQLALEVDTAVLCLLLLLVVIQPEQGGEASAGGTVGLLHTKQWQAVERFHLLAQGLEFTLDVTEQLAATLAGEAFTSMRQLQQARTRLLQRLAIAGGAWAAGAVDVLTQLLQRGEHFAFGL